MNEQIDISDKPGMRNFELQGWSGPRLSKEAGLHRVEWDLRHAGSWSSNNRRMGRNGPMVAPGVYQVELTIGNWNQTQELHVLIDPRVAEDGVTPAVLQEQEKLCLQVRDLMSNAQMTSEQIAKALEKTANKESIQNRLVKLQQQFVTAEGRYMIPMLLNQISYLNSMLNRADQKPGRDAYMRYEELKEKLQGFIAEFEQILNDM